MSSNIGTAYENRNLFLWKSVVPNPWTAWYTRLWTLVESLSQNKSDRSSEGRNGKNRVKTIDSSSNNAKIAPRHLTGFSTTHLCERAFSTFLKNKYRNKLNFESNLRLKLSSFKPDFDSSAADKPCQRSYWVYFNFDHLFLSFLTVMTGKWIK